MLPTCPKSGSLKGPKKTSQLMQRKKQIENRTGMWLPGWCICRPEYHREKVAKILRIKIHVKRGNHTFESMRPRDLGLQAWSLQAKYEGGSEPAKIHSCNVGARVRYQIIATEASAEGA